jgi:transcriptional regulator with XRE-family HTH domain
MPRINTLPASVAINGSAMRRKRQLLGLDLAGFAEVSGLDLSSISKIENGVRQTVSVKTFRRICDGLGLNSPSERAEIVQGSTGRAAA